MFDQRLRQRIYQKASPSIQSKSQKLKEVVLDDDWPTILDDNQEQNNIQQKEVRKKLWRKFFNVYLSLKFFQKPKIQTISNQFELLSTLEQMHNQSTHLVLPIETQSQNFNKIQKIAILNAEQDVKQAFQEIKSRSKLFQLVQSPQANTLDQMKKILNQDTRRFIYAQDHPLRLINQKNQDGVTLLYMACMNGHYSVVQFLIENGANPNIIVEQHGIKTTSLSVSIRWQFYNIAELILQQQNLSRQVLEISLKECSFLKKVPKTIQENIKNQLKNIKK